MVRVFTNGPETWVQSQVTSYQRLKKWYLMPPCLTLSIIRYGSSVKGSNPRKGVDPSPTLWCSSYRKGSLRISLDYGHQLLYSLCTCACFCVCVYVCILGLICFLCLIFSHSWGCKIHQLHLCRGVRPLQWVSWIWHETIWWWGSSNAEALENADYTFIAIAPSSTLTRSGSTW